MAAEFCHDGSVYERKFPEASAPAASQDAALKQMVDDAETLICGNVSLLTRNFVSACETFGVLTSAHRFNRTHADVVKTSSSIFSLTAEAEAAHLCVDILSNKMERKGYDIGGAKAEGPTIEWFEPLLQPKFCRPPELQALKAQPATFRTFLPSIRSFYRTCNIIVANGGGC